MQNGFVQRFFSLDYLIFGRTVIYPKSKANRLVVLNTLLVAVVVIVTHSHIMLKHL